MNNNNYQSFETERLLLRPTTEVDAPFILELLNTPKWKEFIGERNVHTVDDAVAYIQVKMLPQLEKLGYANFTVIRKSDHAKMGSCGLYDREGIDGLDIGFAFLPDYEGKGYGFESASKLIEVAIHEFKIKKISAITTKQNFASQKLIEKIGLKYVKEINIPNDPEELLLYEWEKE